MGLVAGLGAAFIYYVISVVCLSYLLVYFNIIGGKVCEVGQDNLRHYPTTFKDSFAVQNMI